jgi:hypothetical protein
MRTGGQEGYEPRGREELLHQRLRDKAWERNELQREGTTLDIC